MASIYLFKQPYTIGSVPSLSGHAFAYRWRSLPRTAGTGSVNLKVVPNESAAFFAGHHGPIIPLLMCASLSHTHYRYVLCFLPIHSGHQVRWTYQPGSHRRKVTQGFLIHLPSAVRALIFVARRIQPFLSLVDREVEFCVLTN